MMSSGVMPSAFFSPSYAPFASAASIVNESPGRSRRNLVMILVSVPAMSAAHLRAGDRARHPLARLVLVDEDLGVAAADRAVELVVDLQHRREVARGDALD